MSEMELFEAVKAGNADAVNELIKAGVELNQQDKQGWTALNWAAAKGNVEMAELLLENGADPFSVGRDLRTPQMIALAAGQVELVKLLRRAEAEIKGEDAGQTERKYCTAYHLEELRRYSSWTENTLSGKDTGDQGSSEESAEQKLAGSEVVFLHENYKVTKSIWPDEDVIFDAVTDDWKDFCAKELRFAVPDSLDLIPQAAAASPGIA